MIRIRKVSTLAALALGAGWAAGQTPVGSAFAYQGRLTENGQPANGAYDFHIHLYDAAAGGTAINPLGLVLQDIAVADGLFTVSLDFGVGAFNGDARWLSIQVRPGASVGLYTALTPRQPLTPAPYALHALSENWTAVGSAIRNANPGFVGVNRTAPVSGSEFFGVQAPVETGYGGMYIRTDGETAKPFYGYRAGLEAAWTYLDGGTGNWIVDNDGARLTVTDTGEVGVGTSMPTARLHAVTSSASTNAARFESTNAASTASAVVVNHAGGGLAVWGKTTGTGSAGRFEISNSGNSSPALDVRTTGTGPAAKFTGGSVEVGGELHATIGTVMNRATPVAFGKFFPVTTPTLLNSSGNVSVTYEGSEGYRVMVVGEGDPETWTVVTSISYSSADTSIEYAAKSGPPLSIAGQPGNGVVYIKSVCKAGCDQFQPPHYINFVIYKGH